MSYAALENNYSEMNQSDSRNALFNDFWRFSCYNFQPEKEKTRP